LIETTTNDKSNYNSIEILSEVKKKSEEDKSFSSTEGSASASESKLLDSNKKFEKDLNDA
jgi:hypothetical protein